MIDKVAATIRLQVHVSMVVIYQCTENSDTATKAGYGMMQTCFRGR